MAWRSARTGNGWRRPGRINTVTVWDATSGQEILTLKGHTNSVWRGVQPGRETACVGSGNGW